MSKVFIDTNILIYCQDCFDIEKQRICRDIIRQIVKEQAGVISTQVLQGYYIAATRKLKIDPILVKEIMHSFENFEVVNIVPDIIKEAIDCNVTHNISFWDSLIVCSAEYAKCSRILTEDLSHGQIIRGVEIFNPFKS